MGLMITEPDPERITLPSQECWGIKDSRIKCKCLPHAWLPELEHGFVQFQGQFLEPLVKEVLVTKLKLLCERVLIRSLATLKLLAEEEMDLPLQRLRFLPGQ
jgi:hypothetical protein